MEEIALEEAVMETAAANSSTSSSFMSGSSSPNLLGDTGRKSPFSLRLAKERSRKSFPSAIKFKILVNKKKKKINKIIN